MKSSVYDDRQFELDALGRSKPVETGDSICNVLRATEVDIDPMGETQFSTHVPRPRYKQ